MLFSYLLCFPAIPLILNDYAQNYGGKFNEKMIEIKCTCAVKA